jgi:O-antigen biosynthesis protein WbqV
VGEAADLVLTAATHSKDAAAVTRASTYVLKMGQPVKIIDLANRMIRLSGFEPGVDIEVAFSGARPGERLNEILFAKDEKRVDIGVEGVLAAQTVGASLPTIAAWKKRLDAAILAHDRPAAEAVLCEAIPTFAQRFDTLVDGSQPADA